MTDAEIIKALEEHYRQVDAGYSTHLEYGGKGDEHEEKYIYMLRDTLDLINRQQAEIESLKNECFCLANERDAMADCLNEAVEEAKSEAYKEFAERLKRKAKKPYGNFYEPTVFVEDIDNLLKEMG